MNQPILTGAAVLLASATLARADASQQAVALFDQGMQDYDASRYDKACKEFADSLALLPDSGTKGALARCYEKIDRVATAWSLWRELADAAPSPSLRLDAGKRAQALLPSLPRFVVHAQTLQSSLTVTVNGVAIDASTEVPLPTDPGSLTVKATAPGYKDWISSATATKGETTRIEIPPMEALPPLDTRDNADAAHVSGVGGPAAPRSHVVRNATTVTTAILLASALGAELWGEHTYSQAQHEPDDSKQAGEWSSANHERYAAEALLGAGLACGAWATWLWLKRDAPERPDIARRSTLSMSPFVFGHGGGLAMAGSW
ncbi:MAG: hypothetical protein K8W52_24300 [Deltaproteobacteria bacterium]|nr:hypothetical protein [Deltaproteobacteria bacterium]